MTRSVETENPSTTDTPLDERIAWGVLHAAGVSAAEVGRVAAVGGARAALEAGLDRIGIGRRKPFARDRAERALARFVDEGGHILGGPARAELGAIDRAPSPPLVVYARGASALLAWDAPRVAIVGTRHPTVAGRALAGELAQALAERGAHVVSGGAQGIDLAAHRGALERGATTAILGESLSSTNDPRPARLRSLFVDGARALAVTPFGPAHGDARGHFASRNRFVAALADVVVVVEAGARSGTLHTAEAAWRMGVPIVARALDDDDAHHAGARALLAQGVATDSLDVDEILSIARASRAAARERGSSTEVAAAPDAQRPPVFARRERARGGRARVSRVPSESLYLPFPPTVHPASDAARSSDDVVVRALAALGGRADRDALARALSLDAGALSSRIALLELDGVVAREGAFVVLRA